MQSLLSLYRWHEIDNIMAIDNVVKYCAFTLEIALHLAKDLLEQSLWLSEEILSLICEQPSAQLLSSYHTFSNDRSRG